MAEIWAGEPRGAAGAIGPEPGVDRSQIIFGGGSERAFARVATRGAGWIGGSRGVEAFTRGAEGVRRAWAEQGRTERPRLLALPYFALGPRAEENTRAFLMDHSAIEGAAAARVMSHARTDAASVRDAMTAYERAGCDELVMFPSHPDPEQVRLLADVVR